MFYLCLNVALDTLAFDSMSVSPKNRKFFVGAPFPVGVIVVAELISILSLCGLNGRSFDVDLDIFDK